MQISLKRDHFFICFFKQPAPGPSQQVTFLTCMTKSGDLSTSVTVNHVNFCYNLFLLGGALTLIYCLSDILLAVFCDSFAFLLP